MVALGAILIAIALDLAFGEPPSRFHPVVGMGSFLRRVRERAERAPWPLAEGGFWWLAGAAATYALARLAATLLEALPASIAAVATGVMLWPLFSLRSLIGAADEVRASLARGDLPAARRLAAWHLVSRDTSDLDPEEVAGAAISSVAENFTDSVVSPLAAFVLFGLPGAAVYRFMNTADAVLGYRDGALDRFGRVSARADDFVNYLPARLAAGLLLAACLPSWIRLRNGLVTLMRDGPRTPSPNGGHTMASVAGALGVRLAKRGTYVLHAAGRPPTHADLREAQRLVALASMLWMACLVALTMLGSSRA